MDAADKERRTVLKGVRLFEDQVAWLDANSINASDLMRKLLDEEIASRDRSHRDDETDQKATAAVSA